MTKEKGRKKEAGATTILSHHLGWPSLPCPDAPGFFLLHAAVEMGSFLFFCLSPQVCVCCTTLPNNFHLTRFSSRFPSRAQSPERVCVSMSPAVYIFACAANHIPPHDIAGCSRGYFISYHPSSLLMGTEVIVGARSGTL